MDSDDSNMMIAVMGRFAASIKIDDDCTESDIPGDW